MGGPDEAVLDDSALRLWVRVYDLRVLVLFLGMVATAFGPRTAGGRGLALLLLACGLLPYSLFLSLRLRRVHRLEMFMPITDVLASAAYVAAAPSTWGAVVAAASAQIALAVVMFGRRTATIAMAVGIVAFELASLRVPGGGLVAVCGFAAGSTLIILTVGSVHTRERQSRTRYEELVNGIQGVVWEYDTSVAGLTLVSEQVESILGWTVEEALDLETWRTRRVGDGPTPIEALSAALAEGRTTIEFQALHADGHPVSLRARATITRDASGAIRTVRGIIVDTTELRRNRLALRQLADVIENMQFGMTIWHLEDPDDDESLVMTRRNPASIELFPAPVIPELGARLVDMFPSETGIEFARFVVEGIRSGEHATMRDVPYPRPDGTDGWFSMRMIPLPGRCAALVCEDVTDQHHAENALRHQALHDSLTGLPNRALMQDRLAGALAAARRTGDPLALLVMDLDQFKEVNDTLGHPMGDHLLVEVGSRLATVLRDCDTVARLGGDEFAVLLTTDATTSGAQRVAQRIRDELGRPFDLGGVAVQAASSIGIVLSPDHGEDAGTLTQRADIAMYNAKRSGRGWAFYSPEDDRTSVRRLAFVSELRRALERDELVMHYQPQIDLATGHVVGVEALVRWHHPDHGLLLPAEFIQLAEVSGIIQPLTRWVVRTAVAQAARLQEAGHSLVVGANVSGRNLYDPDLARGIAADLAEFDVLPEMLLLELTESELVDDPSQVMTVLTLVSGMGVRVAIDDFGTGWSSLANLTRLPVHQIKIDRSFVSRMTDGGDDAVIVRSIIDLGHNLGLTVVAEGMENTPTMRALTDLGCDQGQGYLVSKPMPAERLVDWLAAREPESIRSS